MSCRQPGNFINCPGTCQIARRKTKITKAQEDSQIEGDFRRTRNTGISANQRRY